MYPFYWQRTERQNHHGIIIPDKIVKTHLVIPPVFNLHCTGIEEEMVMEINMIPASWAENLVEKVEN